MQTRSGFSRCLRVTIVFLLLASMLTLVKPRFVLASEDVGVGIEQLLVEIRKSLIRIRSATSNSIALQEGKLILKTALEVSAGGKVRFWVIRFGSDIKRDIVQTVTIDLAPPSAGDSLPVSSISDTLAAAVIAAYEATERATRFSPPLTARKIRVDLNFTVKRSAGAGGGLEFSPIDISASGSVADTATQTISLTFGRR